jgi:hypothetical protein
MPNGDGHGWPMDLSNRTRKGSDCHTRRVGSIPTARILRRIHPDLIESERDGGLGGRYRSHGAHARPVWTARAGRSGKHRSRAIRQATELQ